MKKITNIAIVLILVLAVAAVIVLKQNNKAAPESKAPQPPVEQAPAAEVVVKPQLSSPNPAQECNSIPKPAPEIPVIVPDKAREIKALPRLIDLGWDKCIPCKMMAPILEELKKEYAGIFDVQFIDIVKNPAEVKKYGIKIMPTQIFYDASGKELYRHENFFSKEDILSKWKELGIDIEKAPKNKKSN